MLKIIGGTYFEVCREPDSIELYGSGFRAAAALSGQGESIQLITCFGEDEKTNIESISSTFGFEVYRIIVPVTVTFDYYHPLSRPVYYPDFSPLDKPIKVEGDHVLYFGVLEASFSVKAKYLVYDPQNHVNIRATSSQAEHLALVLNQKEAYLLSQLSSDTAIQEVGEVLLKELNAEVVIIKHGVRGAFLFCENDFAHIPIFETNSVWPIGSGDIFSSLFAWNWMIKGNSPIDSAKAASIGTAQYCETRNLPAMPIRREFKPLPFRHSPKSIYLAGPFFNISDRWLINELRLLLLEFGCKVFSPMHDAGFGSPNIIVPQEFKAIETVDTVLAVLSTLDAGTIFEIGYAKSKGKNIVVFAEGVTEDDLFMMRGSEIFITNDLSTAIYKATW